MQHYAALFSAMWIFEKVLKQIEQLQCLKQEKWPEMIQDGATILQKYGKQICFELILQSFVFHYNVVFIIRLLSSSRLINFIYNFT